MPTVHYTSHLSRFFPGLEDGRAYPAATIAELLLLIDADWPGIRDYLVDEQGALRKHVNVFVGDRHVGDRSTLADALSATDRVHVLQALSGG